MRDIADIQPLMLAGGLLACVPLRMAIAGTSVRDQGGDKGTIDDTSDDHFEDLGLPMLLYRQGDKVR